MRRVRIDVPRTVSPGAARVKVTMTDTAGNDTVVNKTITIPKRLRRS